MRDAPPEGARLQEARDEEGDGGIGGGQLGRGAEEAGGDEAEVQKRRRAGRQDEPLQRVQHAREQRSDGHEGEVGHRDAGEQHGEIVVGGVIRLAAMDDQQHPRHEDLGKDGEGGGRGEQDLQCVFGNRPGGFRTISLQRARIGRHESRGKGALSEDAAEQVRELLSGRPGIAHRPGADLGGEDDVARKAEDTAGEGEGRLYGGVANQAHATRFP